MPAPNTTTTSTPKPDADPRLSAINSCLRALGKLSVADRQRVVAALVALDQGLTEKE